MSLNMSVTVPSGAGWTVICGPFALDGARDAVDRGVDAAGGDALQLELERERAFEVALHAQLLERRERLRQQLRALRVVAGRAALVEHHARSS